MSSRDYAKMYSGRNRGPSGSRVQYLLAGILLLIFVVGVLYFIRHPGGILQEREKALRDRLHLSQQDNTAVQAKPAAETANPVAFDFYNSLPATASGTVSASADIPVTSASTARENVAVKVPQVTIQSAARQSAQGSHTPSAHYVLQLGVFSDRKAAARTRLNFLLAGVDSIIVSETSDGGKILFRIQQGSYLTERAARTAGAKFRRHGVAAVVRRVVDVDATVPT